MHALKTPSFFRPSSRSSTPAPTTTPSNSESVVNFEQLDPLGRSVSGIPLNRLTLTSRKRLSLLPTSPPTPTLVHDGSYLDVLSLKLSGAVSKALAQPVGPLLAGESLFNGKRALPSGRGSALGTLIAAELEASASNSHLHRAIIRSLHRPLSVLLTHLSAQLLPLISSTQFMAHPSSSSPGTVQVHALSYATFAAELLEVFAASGLGQTEHGTGVVTDNLWGIREGLESVIARVISPLVHGIKNEVDPLIESVKHCPSTLAPFPNHTRQGFIYPKGTYVALHPAIMILQNLIPLHGRNLTRYVTPPTRTSQATLATLLISFIWHSLVALSHRPCGASSSIAQPAVSPQPPMPTLRKKYLGNITPPSPSSPSARFMIKLPPSCPPSPPIATTLSAAADARALLDLLRALPRPNENGRYALAREAVDEAFGGLAALCTLLDVEATGELKDLDVITADLPTVIALPVLLRIFAVRVQTDKGGDGVPSVESLLRLTEEEYRVSCLSGFSRAEECGPLVAKRVSEALVEHRDAAWDPVIRWLDGRVILDD